MRCRTIVRPAGLSSFSPSRCRLLLAMAATVPTDSLAPFAAQGAGSARARRRMPSRITLCKSHEPKLLRLKSHRISSCGSLYCAPRTRSASSCNCHLFVRVGCSFGEPYRWMSVLGGGRRTRLQPAHSICLVHGISFRTRC